MTTHPVRPAAHQTDGALGVRLLLLGGIGVVFGYVLATSAVLGLWAIGIAQQEGSTQAVTILTVAGVLAAVIVLGGFVLAGRALAGRAWWLALPSLLVGPVFVAAQMRLF